jgi:glycosyltransferase involved in cell wall biosynthesis
MSEEAKGVVVSVVVPTFNREVLLRDLLESLVMQTLPGDQWELVIVDDASKDRTADLIEEFRAKLPCRLVYHVNPVNGGAPFSRNQGVRLAKGRILAFTDSDCRVPPRWLEMGLSGFTTPEVGLVSGPTRNDPSQKMKFFCLGAASGPQSGEDPIYPLTNVFYPAEVFASVGGFSEDLYFGNAGEMPVDSTDVNMGWKVREAGYRTAFMPDMVVYHAIRMVSPWAWLVSHARYSGIPFLIKLHPGLRSYIVWWGPFCFFQNFLFYVALVGLLVSSMMTVWGLLLVLPLLLQLCWFIKPSLSPVTWPKAAVQIAFLSAGQVMTCGSLLYGSIRSRRLIL